MFLLRSRNKWQNYVTSLKAWILFSTCFPLNSIDGNCCVFDILLLLKASCREKQFMEFTLKGTSLCAQSHRAVIYSMDGSDLVLKCVLTLFCLSH